MSARLKTAWLALAAAIIAAVTAWAAVIATEPTTDPVGGSPDAGVLPADAGFALDSGPPDAGPPDAGLDAGTPPTADAGSGSDLRALGTLPGEVAAALTWPAVPAPTTDMVAATAAQLRTALGTPRTRVRVTARLTGTYEVSQSDTVILFDDGAGVDQLFVRHRVSRVLIRGGVLTRFEIMAPVDYGSGPGRPDPTRIVTDVTVERTRSGVFILRGRRHALLGVTTEAPNGSVWVGDTLGIPNEDIIVAHSSFRSAGPEATLRMHDVIRSVVVYNRLFNGTSAAGIAKHNYRIHGTSDLNFAAHNTLYRTSFMIGTEPGDVLNRQWFVDNDVYYNATNGVFALPAGCHTGGTCPIAAFVLTDNRVYSNDGFAPPAASGWVVARNTVAPFTALPPW